MKKINLYRFIVAFGFLGLWQLSAYEGWIDTFYFSSPIEILSLFIKNMTDLSFWRHMGITFIESWLSFLFIMFISIFLASLFWFIPTLGEVFEPLFILLNSIPKSALAPLFIVWLGTGAKTIIVCGISVGVFGCIMNIYHTFLQTDPERIKLIQTLGGNKMHVYFKIMIPGNIPFFISVAKVQIGLALVGVIIGEFLGGRNGLGYLIIYGSQVFALDLVILCILLLCLFATMFYGMIHLIEKKCNKYF